MIDIKNVFPECDADTLLVRLIMKNGLANHQSGFPKVIFSLEKRKDSNETIIGLIDSDKFTNKNENRYFSAFSEILLRGAYENEGLELRKIPHKPHYLIFVHPEFEPWIWKQAQLSDVSPSDYKFESLSDVYAVSKHYGTRAVSEPGLRFKKFVNAVVQANPPGIVLLRKWLNENDFTSL